MPQVCDCSPLEEELTPKFPPPDAMPVLPLTYVIPEVVPDPIPELCPNGGTAGPLPDVTLSLSGPPMSPLPRPA